MHHFVMPAFAIRPSFERLFYCRFVFSAIAVSRDATYINKAFSYFIF